MYQTCRERERAAARSQDERDRLDKLQQEFAQESSVIKAQMQQQIVKMLHDHQVRMPYIPQYKLYTIRYYSPCGIYVPGGKEEDGGRL
jgi:hypothetical protein